MSELEALMGFSGLNKLNPYPNTKLVAQKIEEWEWMNRFIETNPDIKQRYETHKTFEILKDEHITKR